MDETDSSMGHVKETLHSPNDETDSNAVRLKEPPPTLERTDRLHHAVCNRNSYKRKTRHTSTGRVRKIPHQTNDETHSNAGRVRETPEPLNDETDCSTGRVRETAILTNDETDSSTGRVRETPHRRTTRKITTRGMSDRLPARRKTSQFPAGGVQKKLPTYGTTRPNERTYSMTVRVRETFHQH